MSHTKTTNHAQPPIYTNGHYANEHNGNIPNGLDWDCMIKCMNG